MDHVVCWNMNVEIYGYQYAKTQKLLRYREIRVVRLPLEQFGLTGAFNWGHRVHPRSPWPDLIAKLCYVVISGM
jgi:hypothetical protein